MRADKPLLLLDRDGTLITEQDYLKDPRLVRLLPGVAAGLKRLARARFPMVIVTNQSGVGRGLMTQSDVRKVHARLQALLKQKGIRLNGIYWCPHRPNASCACRKPRLALVKRAARDLRRPWKRSVSIGDKWSDVDLGRKTGGSGILVLTGYGKQQWKQRQQHAAPAFVARDFQTAARWIIAADNKEPSRWTRNFPKT